MKSTLDRMTLRFQDHLFLQVLVLEGQFEGLDVVLLHPLVGVDLDRNAHLRKKEQDEG